jgi:hypothetical protein
MNRDNYVTLEAAQRLVDAGIVLETDTYWIKFAQTGNGPDTRRYVLSRYQTPGFIPTYTFAELWRELPVGTIMVKEPDGISCVHSFKIEQSKASNTNPADALADLLIWVKGQNRERIVKKLLDHADRLKW